MAFLSGIYSVSLSTLKSEFWLFFPFYRTWSFVDVAAAFLHTCPDLFKAQAAHSGNLSRRVTSLAQQQQARTQPACIESSRKKGGKTCLIMSYRQLCYFSP